MEYVLFVDGDRVRELTPISDNISNKLLNPACFEAQDTRFREVVGDAMIDKLSDLVRSGDIYIEGNEVYKGLLDTATRAIAYEALVQITITTAAKIDNAGVSSVGDEKMTPMPFSDVLKVRDFYQKKADFAFAKVQTYCWDNRKDLPELCECKIAHIHSNLLTSASSGIYLGGRRGCHKHNVR